MFMNDARRPGPASPRPGREGGDPACRPGHRRSAPRLRGGERGRHDRGGVPVTRAGVASSVCRQLRPAQGRAGRRQGRRHRQGDRRRAAAARCTPSSHTPARRNRPGATPSPSRPMAGSRRLQRLVLEVGPGRVRHAGNARGRGPHRSGTPTRSGCGARSSCPTAPSRTCICNCITTRTREVYLNGVLAAKLTGYTTGYGKSPISEEARKTLRPGRQRPGRLLPANRRRPVHRRRPGRGEMTESMFNRWRPWILRCQETLTPLTMAILGQGVAEA